MGLTAVSLFAGCGGFSEGITRAGFKIKVAVEWDKFACQTYRHNFPGTPLVEADIHDFLTNHDRDHWLSELQGIDLVFGGPPCQGFSQIGPRDLFDPRNELYLQYARVVSTLAPKMFVMENVPNILSIHGGHFKKAIPEHFASLGYKNTTFVKVSAADFGVPQTRERVFFIGTRDSISKDIPLAGLVTSLFAKAKRQKHVTVNEAIGDLPEAVVESGEVTVYPRVESLSAYMKEMRRDTSGVIYKKIDKRRSKSSESQLYNHHTKNIQARRKALIALLAPGAKADTLPKNIWNGARPEKWRRLHPDLPSYTILAQMHRDLSEWVHPAHQRWISVREAARLQSFHDGFEFQSSEWQMLKQIGNAVPPLLAREIGIVAQAVLKSLNSSDNPIAQAANQNISSTEESPSVAAE